jgi:hypothetical protein
MNDEQRYLFDIFGYLVVPDVLSADQIDELRSTLKSSTEQFPPVPQSEGPLHWGKIWRELLDLPVITEILEAMIGNPSLRAGRQARAEGAAPLPTFRLDHINVHTHVQQGFKGGMLHGGWDGVSGLFRYDNGVFYNGLTSVTFELYDTHPNNGGFCCIPGSHKANRKLPAKWADLSQGVPSCVERVAARPGDAIIFTEALTHGTLPWTAAEKRMTLFYKFSPHNLTWSADFYDPEDFRQYDDMDERKIALLEPPNARYRRRPSRPSPRHRE